MSRFTEDVFRNNKARSSVRLLHMIHTSTFTASFPAFSFFINALVELVEYLVAVHGDDFKVGI